MDILAYTNKTACNGCGACVNICPCEAITMEVDEFGFKYPVINSEKCVKCEKCVSVCKKTQSLSCKYPLKALAGSHKDFSVLNNSSSGGAFSVLAEHILKVGGAVCGCIFDSNLQPIHICTEKHEDFLLMRKSKYAQSDVNFVYKEIASRLKKNQPVLFCGTPCQVSALYSVVGTEFTHLLTVDLVCHGVPSNTMFQKFLRYLEKKHKTKITDFNFRSKKYGWQRFTMEFIDNFGKVKNIGKYNEFYIPAFTSGNIIRPSCFECRYANPYRIGDISLADFWGHEKINLPFNVINGCSLITINNEHSLELISLLSDTLNLKEIDYQTAINGNTCLRNPTPKGNKWEQYMDALKSDTIDTMAKKYIKNNKKRIFISKLKLQIPNKLFLSLKKFQKKILH